MTPEQPRTPPLEICDPHHHLDDRPGHSYLIPELMSDLRGAHDVRHSVYIECGLHHLPDGPQELRPVGETAWVASLSRPDGALDAIVGFADLTSPSVDHILDEHLDVGDGRFRGVRHVTTWHPSAEVRNGRHGAGEGLMNDESFRSGVLALGRKDLSFDAWLYFTQVHELTELAGRCPDTRIVVDHLGGMLGIGPYEGRRSEVQHAWRAAMKELARRPNVWVKIGGLGMSRHGLGWQKRTGGVDAEAIARQWGPAVRWCVETFGPDRCMLESNFPLDRSAFTYETCWDGFELMTEDLSDQERRRLFHGTAVEFYRIDCQV